MLTVIVLVMPISHSIQPDQRTDGLRDNTSVTTRCTMMHDGLAAMDVRPPHTHSTQRNNGRTVVAGGRI